MKLKTKEAPSEEQRARIKGDMASWARERLADPSTVIIDLETTGILSKDPDTEIVQVSLINTSGRPLLSALIRPERPIPLEAQKIHGIDDRMVLGSPTFAQIGGLIAMLIHRRHVVAYNAAFDVHTLVHMLGKYGIDMPDFETSCAMEAYSAWCGEWQSSKKDWKWQKLPKLAYGSAHDSLVDCASTLLLLKKMAGDHSDEPNAESIDLDF